MKTLIAVALATLIAAPLTLTSGAYARVKIQPGAHASVAGTSEEDIRQQCAQGAYARWGRNNQDMQTNVDFFLRNCLSDHGVRNP
jgi:hypothetical protein